MTDYVSLLQSDFRFAEGLRACMNCGVCSAICPAAAVFDDYDPRRLCQIVQRRDNELLRQLLESDVIWRCGQCMGCRTRCPRNNTPGYIIQSLRRLSIDTGLYLLSEQGRKQIKIAQTVGKNLLTKGYCVDMDLVVPEAHPEQGPIWEWAYSNRRSVCNRCGGQYHGQAGAQRQLDEKTFGEMQKIIEVTGGKALINRQINGE